MCAALAPSGFCCVLWRLCCRLEFISSNEVRRHGWATDAHDWVDIIEMTSLN